MLKIYWLLLDKICDIQRRIKWTDQQSSTKYVKAKINSLYSFDSHSFETLITSTIVD